MKHIKASEDNFASNVGDYIISQAVDCLKKKSCFKLVLSGGRTPLSIFEYLVEKQDQLDWSKVELYWLDERCVSIDSPDSNFGNCLRTLIERLEVKPKYYPMYEAESPEAAANTYERLLRERFRPDQPDFDLVLIGVGPDGHIASIFPENDYACDSCWVMSTESPNPPHQRVTLTIPVINQINVKLFIVKGDDKKWVFDACMSNSLENIPACQIDGRLNETVWFTCFSD